MKRGRPPERECGMNIVAKSGINVLIPEGDLTILETAEFREALLALQEKEGPIELDLAQVHRRDSSAVRLVVAAIPFRGLKVV